MDRNLNGMEFARIVKENARHSFAWYSRNARIGKAAAVLSLLSSLAVIGYDFWLEWSGCAAEDLIAEIVPGSMVAHLYFRFVQNIAFQLDDRRIVLLAAFGALVVLSLEVLLFVQVFRGRTMKGLALFLFADTVVTWYVVCALASGFAFAGMILRVLLGVLLLRGHNAEKWQKWLFAAEEILWASEKYGWAENFDPLTLTDEEWKVIHEDYYNHVSGKEENP